MDPQKFCQRCEKQFIRKQKGWKRVSVMLCNVSPGTYTQDGFLCLSCAQDLRGVSAPPKKSGRKRVISTPVKHVSKKLSTAVTFCLRCEKKFIRKKKGWKRVSVKLCNVSPGIYTQDGFLCSPCAKELKPKRPPKNSGRPVKPAHKKLSTPVIPAHKKFESGSRMKDMAVSQLYSGHYAKAFSCLMNCPAGAKAYNQLLSKKINKETKSHPRQTSLTKDATVEDVNQWNWQAIIDEAETHMPLLMLVLKASMPDDTATQQQNQRRLGMIVAIILYSRQPRVFKYLQGCLSVQLWKRGCSQSIMQLLQPLGICKGPRGTRLLIDRINASKSRSELDGKPASDELPSCVADASEEEVESMGVDAEEADNMEIDSHHISLNEEELNDDGSATDDQNADDNMTDLDFAQTGDGDISEEGVYI